MNKDGTQRGKRKIPTPEISKDLKIQRDTKSQTKQGTKSFNSKKKLRHRTVEIKAKSVQRENLISLKQRNNGSRLPSLFH